MVITLVGKNIAKIGYSFTHLGGTEICTECPLFKACVDPLEKNTTYKIIEIREKEHTCLIDNQIMVICDVKETNDTVTVENQKYLENMIIQRSSIKCDEILCEYYDNCIHPRYNKITRVKIQKLIKKINCPISLDLILVEARKAEK
jgi:uncharacterized protein (UPF0179 family)